MRAALIDKYGPPGVVRVADVAKPEPKADEVLVRVHAVAVTSADARIRGARFPRGAGPFARLAFGIRRPRRPILGSSFSGVVEAAGDDVTGVKPGDAVCGMAGLKMGAHAEYLAVGAKKVAAKPEKIGHEDAAGLLFGASTALFYLRDKGEVSRGGSVLVNGASGAVGTSAVQLAKHVGAVVTGVTSGANTELVHRLGADRVVDYAREDLSDLQGRFDAVLDAVGNLGFERGRRLLNDTGVYLPVVADLWGMVTAPLRTKVASGVAPERVADFEYLLQLVADGELEVVIDQVYELSDVVAAYERVDTGHKVGNVVLRP